MGIWALIAYGVDVRKLYRIAAMQVDQILKGAKVEDLPVHQPTNFDLVINLKTATALGLSARPRRQIIELGPFSAVGPKNWNGGRICTLQDLRQR
jgi:ABC transporter substrate binding protein